jgi:hypothetical protein
MNVVCHEAFVLMGKFNESILSSVLFFLGRKIARQNVFENHRTIPSSIFNR